MGARNIWNTLKMIGLSASRAALMECGLLKLLTGTYSRTWTEKGIRVSESITLHRVSAITELYQIEQITIHHRSDNPEKENTDLDLRECWYASYDSSRRQLIELDNGTRQISFVPEQMLALMGKRAYVRVSSVIDPKMPIDGVSSSFVNYN